MKTDPQSLVIREATTRDVEVIFSLIQALADYEKLSHEVVGSPENLREHLFGETSYAEVILAEFEQKIVGFALFFPNYSSFLTQPGIYLEDLFVLPDYRGKGIGKALISSVAKRAVSRGCRRLEWNVLDWNQPAIDFYQNMGADLLQDWRTCHVTGNALVQLSQRYS